jgi:cation transport ATPase
MFDRERFDREEKEREDQHRLRMAEMERHYEEEREKSKRESKREFRREMIQMIILVPPFLFVSIIVILLTIEAAFKVVGWILN